jgi:phage shock protein A
MIHQVVRDMEDVVQEAVGDLARAMAEQKRLERQTQQLSADVANWQQKAERALAADGEQAGQEEYARQALRKKVALEGTLSDTERALTESRGSVAELRAQLDEMRDKLHQAKAREGTLIAKAKAARAGGGEEAAADASDPFRRFQRLEQGVNGHEAELTRFEEKVDAAAAEAELYREMAGTTRTDLQLAEVEREKKIDDELAALRDRVRSQG